MVMPRKMCWGTIQVKPIDQVSAAQPNADKMVNLHNLSAIRSTFATLFSPQVHQETSSSNMETKK